jgi:hypothetical protein
VQRRATWVVGYLVASAMLLLLIGDIDRPWVLVWLLGLIAVLGWRNEQPVLRVLFDWLPLLVILAAYDLIRAHADSLISPRTSSR